VHNTFLWVAADWGIPGAICFLGFVGSALTSLYRLQRNSSDQRLGVDCLTLQVALVGFLVVGIFGNRLYAEMVYWLTALAVARHNIAWNVWAQDEQAAPEIEFGHSFPPVAAAPAGSPPGGARPAQAGARNARSQGSKVHG
jgi:hypothetical protein